MSACLRGSAWRPIPCPWVPRRAGNYLSGQLVEHGGQAPWVRGGHRPGRRWHGQRGRRRKPVPGEGRHCLHAAAAASILSGITRDTIIHLARDLGIEVREQALPREMLYMCDELFFTGTAAEVTPIRSVDGLEVGSGARGPVTESIAGRLLRAVFRRDRGSPRLAGAPGYRLLETGRRLTSALA